MSNRPLGADEAALWRRLVATVEPLERRVKPPEPIKPDAAKPVAAKKPPAKLKKPARAAPPPKPAKPPPVPPPAPMHSKTLDGSWDRALSRGNAQPDYTIDLHGNTLDSAYARLDSALEMAIVSGFRLILLITGKPRDGVRPGEPGKPARGVIRAVVSDWLASSRHASAIAAVRRAHPRHGGQGALYIVLKRRR